MAVCADCGVENEQDARFCKACATPFHSPPKPREQRKMVTAVFCDVVGSTALGESADPETVRRVLERYFKRMREIVERHGGTVQKFIGDAVVAIFGVPTVHEDDALRALRAALEMREALPELGVGARIGVNTGEVVTSSDDTLVTGDAVNVAARLQQAAGADQILVGAETVALARGAALVEQLEPLEFKGKTDPVAAFRLVGVGEAPERVHGSRFVGRASELALLGDAWARAVERGSCELVTIVGEPGVGKSRLVAELVEGLQARVVQGRCLSYGEGITYFPVVEVIKQLDIVAADPAAAATLAAMLGEGNTATSPEEIAWAFRKLLEQEAPLVVAFDDIQWGEATFLDLVEYVGLFSAQGPLLLVCIARPELSERRPGWPVAIRLEPLGRADVEELLPVSLPVSLRERIVRAAGGNPLFVTEMVAIAAAAGGEEVIVPASLRALLAARLDQLEVAERGVLERGSVEGEVFHQGPVRALTGSQVTAQLGSLVRRELIRPESGLFPGEDAFRFCHLLIRDAAYEALPKATRAELHEQFAEWLDDHGAELVERDELVGYHLQQAYQYRRELGDPDAQTRPLGQRAASRLIGASRRAAERTDYHAVANLLERSLRLGPDSHECVRVQVELGEALFETGRIAESDETLTAAFDAATALGAAGLAARALVRRERYRLTTDFLVDIDASLALAEDAIETLSNLDDPLGLVIAEELLSWALTKQGQTAAAIATHERAVGHASSAGEHNLRRRIVRMLSNNLAIGPTPVDQSIEQCRELMHSSEDDPTLRAAIGRALSALLAMTGRFEEALEQAERSAAVLDQLDSMTWTWFERQQPAMARELAGDRAGAAGDLIAQWRRVQEVRGPEAVGAVNASSRLALLYCDEGRWEEAKDCLAPSQGLAEPTWFRHAHVTRLAARARLTAHDGEHDEAARLARLAVELAEPTDCLNLRAELWLALADVQRAAGHAAEGEASAANALRLYEQKGNITAAARVRASGRERLGAI